MQCPYYEWRDGGLFGTDVYFCKLIQNGVSEAKSYCCKSDSAWAECTYYKQYAR